MFGRRVPRGFARAFLEVLTNTNVGFEVAFRATAVIVGIQNQHALVVAHPLFLRGVAVVAAQVKIVKFAAPDAIGVGGDQDIEQPLTATATAVDQGLQNGVRQPQTRCVFADDAVVGDVGHQPRFPRPTQFAVEVTHVAFVERRHLFGVGGRTAGGLGPGVGRAGAQGLNVFGLQDALGLSGKRAAVLGRPCGQVAAAFLQRDLRYVLRAGFPGSVAMELGESPVQRLAVMLIPSEIHIAFVFGVEHQHVLEIADRLLEKVVHVDAVLGRVNVARPLQIAIVKLVAPQAIGIGRDQLVDQLPALVETVVVERLHGGISEPQSLGVITDEPARCFVGRARNLVGNASTRRFALVVKAGLARNQRGDEPPQSAPEFVVQNHNSLSMTLGAMLDWH